MTIPQSVLVVALVLVWLVVLVPTSSRRRKHVREVVEGSRFRVLRRPTTVRRNLRRGAALQTRAETIASEDDMTTQRPDVARSTQYSSSGSTPWRGNRPVEPERDAEQTVQLALVDESAAAEPAMATPISPAPTSPALGPAPESAPEPVSADDEAPAFRPHSGSTPMHRRSAEPAEAARATGERRHPVQHGTDEFRSRRSGRGTFDPEVAERDRQFKYARRRRVVLALLVLIAGFSAGAVLFTQPILWVAVAACAVLLVLFLLYLRRQVRIEADIRSRRLARLQRAAEIRPEYRAEYRAEYRTEYDVAGGRPEPGAAPGARPHRVSRTPVDLDDDDPSFDHLEEYEPVEYRRAVGQ